MKVVVISDIHGNGVALAAVLAEIKGEAADQIVCLGDAIQGGRSRWRWCGSCRNRRFRW